MADTNPSFSSLRPTAGPSQIALASFANMFSIGTVYALSTLQVELPRLLGVTHCWSFAPFAATCLGLSIGVGSCASLMDQIGARSTASRGTALWGFTMGAAGYFLARSNFQGILVCLCVGGIGVGWAYLSVVIMMGQGFPNQPLARGAIGPLGFSSGAATCIALSSFLQFSSLDAGQLGQTLISGGILIITVAAATAALFANHANTTPSSPQKASASSIGSLFYILLFFNALPGMMVFSALLPIASYFKQEGAHTDPSRILPYSMVSLAVGGLLAAPLSSALGTRTPFVILFYLRGLVLVAFSRSPGPVMAVITLLTILFSHGVGFSILPSSIKAHQPNLAQFPHTYGRILIAWGAAGVVGILVNASLIPSSGDTTVASLLVGLVMVSFGTLLHLLP
ncbi:hypothetical protein EDB80DRAFT_114790 [Ilyonectria destructans]|nr:hypothetical protein EDB80DRAFT_114790 [Ilyonectria destructans]